MNNPLSYLAHEADLTVIEVLAGTRGRRQEGGLLVPPCSLEEGVNNPLSYLAHEADLTVIGGLAGRAAVARRGDC